MEPFNQLTFWLLMLLSYFLGSIPWGLIFSRMFTEEDIRKQGSGNIGATNVRRIAGLKAGLLTLTGDMAKGALPVFLCAVMVESDLAAKELSLALVSLAAFMGHLFSVFLKFKGGKGVATAAGCFLVISPLACLTVVMVFVVVVIFSSRVSPGSIVSALLLPLIIWWTNHSIALSGCSSVIAFFIIFRHIPNIHRLISGTEPTFRK